MQSKSNNAFEILWSVKDVAVARRSGGDRWGRLEVEGIHAVSSYEKVVMRPRAYSSQNNCNKNRKL